MDLHTTIVIEANAEHVWEILTDFDAYPEWNPFIRRIQGELKVGAQLDVQMQPSGGDSMNLRLKLLKVEPGRELRWFGHFVLRGLYDGVHSFKIEPIEAGFVRFTQRQVITGVLVGLMRQSLQTETRRGFEEMNQALKMRAEKSSDIKES